MRCPFCGDTDNRVVDSREARDGFEIRRRRECGGCGRRFTTYERVDDVPLLVAKRSGAVEPFERAKLAAGIERAASGRLDPEVVVEVVDQVEEVVRAGAPQVGSDVIGVTASATITLGRNRSQSPLNSTSRTLLVSRTYAIISSIWSCLRGWSSSPA